MFPYKIIFLDIDGVLNSGEWYENNSMMGNIDPNAVERLRKIVEITSAEIVLISSWRGEDKIFKEFESFTKGLKLFAITNPFTDKGSSLIEWLEKYKNEDYKWVIIDDNPSEYDEIYHKHLIKTMYRTGLTDKEMNEVIKYLEN